MEPLDAAATLSGVGLRSGSPCVKACPSFQAALFVWRVRREYVTVLDMYAIRATIWLSAALVTVATAATPARASTPRFRAYVACGTSDPGFSAPASHHCIIGNLPQAVLVDRQQAETRYRVCVTAPRGRRTCHSHSTAEAGKLSQDAIAREAVGSFTISWYVAGRLIRRWAFTMGAGD